MISRKHAVTFLRGAAALAPAVAVVFLCASAAGASEGHAAPRWDDFTWRVVNAVLFVGILWHFVGKLAKKFFRDRREGIAAGLDDLEARRKKAREELEDVEHRIRNLESERKAILDESLAQAESLKRSIIADAERQAEQIVNQARLTAENEGRAVIAEVRSIIADEVVAATEKALLQRLGGAEQEKLINKALDKVVLQ